MAKKQRDIASFVLRFTQDVWDDERGDPHVEWRGHIRHVQGDDEFHFTELTDALQFIQKSLMQLTMDAMPAGDKPYQEKAMRESFKLWDNFAKSYTDMMMQAVQQTVKQSEVLNKQMSEAMGQAMQPWWLTGWAPRGKSDEARGLSIEDQERLIQMVFAMQAQLESIALRLNEMEDRVAAVAGDAALPAPAARRRARS